jgi:hypothetical protein
MKRFLTTAGALGLALALSPSMTQAQGPLYDKVMVNLPYTVTIGDHVLQPGPYVIRQMDSPAGGSRVLMIYSDNGMKFETSAITIPALDNRTPEDTKVILHHFGPDYYFDKVWIQGKNYGYEFPLPDSVKSRESERMAPMTVAATYQAEPAQTQQQQQATTTTEQNTNTQTAQNTPPPAPAETPAPAPAPAPEAQPAPAPAPAPVMQEQSANRTMPATSADWLMMLLGGGALSGAGLMLRRRRS